MDLPSMVALLIEEITNQSNQIKCWSLVRGEKQGTQEKTSQSRVETNRLSPRMTASQGIEPEPY